MPNNEQISNTSLEDLDSPPIDVGDSDGGVVYSLALDAKNPIPSLQTVRGKISTFCKMKTNSTISGILLAFHSICQTPKTMVNENKDDPDRARAKRRSEFLQQCLDDMQTPFSDVRGEILDMIPMGFKVMVPQFKARTGYDPDPNYHSRYSDGKIGWKNFTPINPETIEKFNTPDGKGYLGLTGITQRIARNAQEEKVPRNRLLLFRTVSTNNSPIGKSLLEGAYDDWCKLVDANEIQMTGLRRSLEGIPYARIHTKLAKAGNNNKTEKAAVASVKKAIRDLHSKEDNAFILPSDRDDNGNLLVEVGMMGASEGGGNTRIQDAKVVIDAKEQTIARSMLAQFMTIQGKGGSYALSKTQSEVFINSLRVYMTQIEGIFNNEAVPRLFAINGEGTSASDHYLPYVSFSDFIKEDISEFFGALQKAVEFGVFEVTPQVQKKAGQVLNIDISGQEDLLNQRKAYQEELRQAQLTETDPDSGSEELIDAAGDGTEGVPTTEQSDITDQGLLDILNDDSA